MATHASASSSPDREEPLTPPGTGSWGRHCEYGAVVGAVVPTSSLVTALFKTQHREDWVEAGSRSSVKEQREEAPLALTIQGPGEHILSNSVYGGILRPPLWPWFLHRDVSGLSEVTGSRDSTAI